MAYGRSAVNPSMRAVRRVAGESVRAINNQAEVLRDHVVPWMTESEREIKGAIARLDAHDALTFWGRLRWLFLGSRQA